MDNFISLDPPFRTPKSLLLLDHLLIFTVLDLLLFQLLEHILHPLSLDGGIAKE